MAQLVNHGAAQGQDFAVILQRLMECHGEVCPTRERKRSFNLPEAHSSFPLRCILTSYERGQPAFLERMRRV